MLHNWLTKIAPSCVYPKIINGQRAYFECIICSTPCTRQQSMIRHYKEVHWYEMPKNIFGEKETFSCEDCQVIFQRKEHLLAHKESLQHQIRTNHTNDHLSILSAYTEAKESAKTQKSLKRKNAFAKECHEWEIEKKKMKLSTESVEKVASAKMLDASYPGTSLVSYVEEILHEMIENIDIIDQQNDKDGMVRSLSDDMIRNLIL